MSTLIHYMSDMPARWRLSTINFCKGQLWQAQSNFYRLLCPSLCYNSDLIIVSLLHLGASVFFICFASPRRASFLFPDPVPEDARPVGWHWVQQDQVPLRRQHEHGGGRIITWELLRYLPQKLLLNQKLTRRGKFLFCDEMLTFIVLKVLLSS